MAGVTDFSRRASGIVSRFNHLRRRRFDEKLIIIESDDWGLERAGNSEAIAWAKGKFGEDKFTRWTLDALESVEDLNLLYQVLSSVRNYKGDHPVITANFITHNVDYASHESLRFKPLTEGFNFAGECLKDKYKEGIERKLIFPQLHGYSHFNIGGLMDYFNTDEGREAFGMKYFTCRTTLRANLAFLQGEMSAANSHMHRLREAVSVFNDYFGFRPKTVIPPAFILDREALAELASEGIKMLQSGNRLVNSKKEKYNIPYLREKEGFIWSYRNARLDPFPGYDFYHGVCLESIGRAFDSGVPAIIDFHRVNFAGTYASEYRERTIDELAKLLKGIVAKWPDAEFVHSQKLYEMIN